MSTPSEGPDPAARLRTALEAKGYTQEQVEVMMDLAERMREMQGRVQTLESRRSGVRQWGPTVGIAAAAAGAASPQGQEAIGNVGKWTGQQAADGARWAGDQAVAAGNAAVDAAQWSGQQIADGARWVGDQAVAAGNAAVDAAQWTGQQLADGAQWAGQQAVAAGQAISGWSVETWHAASDSVTQAAHAVGAWATQYADAVAQNPSHAAATAAITAGAIVAATPQLRQAVGRAANAASRWARAGFDAVRHPGETVRQISNAIRSNESTQRDLNAVGLDAQQTNTGLNEVTGAVSELPKPAELVVPNLANDPAMKPAGSKVEQTAAAETTGQGEAATPQHRTTGTQERGGLNK